MLFFECGFKYLMLKVCLPTVFLQRKKEKKEKKEEKKKEKKKERKKGREQRKRKKEEKKEKKKKRKKKKLQTVYYDWSQKTLWLNIIV